VCSEVDPGQQSPGAQGLHSLRGVPRKSTDARRRGEPHKEGLICSLTNLTPLFFSFFKPPAKGSFIARRADRARGWQTTGLPAWTTRASRSMTRCASPTVRPPPPPPRVCAQRGVRAPPLTARGRGRAGKLFPYEPMHQWLSYGGSDRAGDAFSKREFSFTLANDIYIRSALRAALQALARRASTTRYAHPLVRSSAAPALTGGCWPCTCCVARQIPFLRERG